MGMISTIVFDLGGVLFELSWEAAVLKWAGDRLSPEQLFEKWCSSLSVRRFEKGEIGFASFKAEFEKEMGISLPDYELETTFRGIVGRPYPGASELLSELSGRYRLACFSNTNPVHWDVIAGRSDIVGLFEKVFLSFRIGMVKPQREAFLYVLHELGCTGNEVVFLDDSEANVRAALSCGMQGLLVSGVDGAREALSGMGLL